ncbi:NAD(P)/FAD-dependent oxidoreductase [Brevibacterium luteolum]|uniref:NAD(P)/FAD-dependent oxidoreductase n=1 Tax=Brevibacterium luteolum TaxID=199591 RepID=UPI003B683E3C
MEVNNGLGSYWLENSRERAKVRPRLDHNLKCDVAIVGAGYTGLWTAFWLKKNDPSLDIVVLEKNFVGFGASGRNGGWLSGKTVGLRHKLLESGVDQRRVLEIERLCHRAPVEVKSLVENAGYDFDAAVGGWMQVSRSESELERQKNAVRSDYEFGLEPDEVRLLSREEVASRVNIAGAVGALYSPHAVKCDPALLVLGLAEMCESLGVQIFESSGVKSVNEGCCQLLRCSVSASTVVVATEGYTSSIDGMERDILPMVSSMIVTEPLTDDAWHEVGWNGFECVSGASHLYPYAQRTGDGRVAIGGRGVPYFWKSGVDDFGQLDRRTIAALSSTIESFFPHVEFKVGHAWCGVLGVTRDWSPFVDVSVNGKLVRLGGYAGQGVAAAYVAARSAADVLCNVDSEYAASPWLRPVPQKWHPEPLRWIGSRVVRELYHFGDLHESIRGGRKTSILGSFGNKLAGR